MLCSAFSVYFYEIRLVHLSNVILGTNEDLETIDDCDFAESNKRYYANSHFQIGLKVRFRTIKTRIIGQLVAAGRSKYSGRPALRSSNKTVNRLKLDTTKASEADFW